MVTPILPLTLRDVELRRGGRRILGPLSLTVSGAGITVLMGPNGSGKTSLLRVMHGLERITRGTVDWQGGAQDVRARQAFVFQTPILMRRKVADCIAYPLHLDGVPRKAARARAAEMAAAVGLADALDKPSAVLSGGEKQKLALARALIRTPEVLFLDEPCANLDGRSTREIESILTRARDAGTRIVMSTHDLGQARRLADEVWFLYGGLLVETAASAAFFAAPRTAQAAAYLKGDLWP
jgi:tungstate transport system ATP-binding protein